jgi:2-dehydro-3-deoxy-D-arabinonate dehydratase
MTKLARFQSEHGIQVGKIEGDTLVPLNLPKVGMTMLQQLLAHSELPQLVRELPASGPPMSLTVCKLLPPIDHQEVWAAGVTYKRSQTARMEESETAASCYDRVYRSPRPELFFKATPHRVSGTGQALRIRKDATWNVPEPELTLVISPDQKLVGFTIGNDMSSRDIEGDNPLYLPQAKCYNQCCGLGPWITLIDDMPDRNSITIELKILREGNLVYTGNTSVAEMARTFEDLIGWLCRDNSFPNGAFLLTGTGIVPDSPFTLQANDQVDITIAGIGTLTNTVVQG